jgi:exodeoxyribonuclease VII large subunit
LWKNEARKVAFEMTDGLAVRLMGRLTVYPPRGDYELVVRQIVPEGIGSLELAFRQRYARLPQDGLFDPLRMTLVAEHHRNLSRPASVVFRHRAGCDA